MHNKLTISALLILLCFFVRAQEDDNGVESGFGNDVQKNHIITYPNPAVKVLNVQISNSTLENIEFELHSIIGNQMSIRVEDLGNGKYKIPVEGLATGYYFLVVIDEEARFKKAYKFLKD